MLQALKKEIRASANPKRAKSNLWFFKTGPGQYGEGDQFLGLDSPTMRQLSKKYAQLQAKGTLTLLHSPIHELRQIALFILVLQFEKGSPALQKKIYSLYLKNTRYINNWDLVDMTAPQIVGGYLIQHPKEKSILFKFAKSEDLWQKRIAILATLTFIRHEKFTDTFRLADILLNDSHDLIHKAVGWMLREVGNRSRPTEEKFLRLRYKKMPRTMLRYAIEKFPEPLRQRYLKGKI